MQALLFHNIFVHFHVCVSLLGPTNDILLHISLQSAIVHHFTTNIAYFVGFCTAPVRRPSSWDQRGILANWQMDSRCSAVSMQLQYEARSTDCHIHLCTYVYNAFMHSQSGRQKENEWIKAVICWEMYYMHLRHPIRYSNMKRDFCDLWLGRCNREFEISHRTLLLFPLPPLSFFLSLSHLVHFA